LIPPAVVEALIVETICQGLVFSIGKIGRLGRVVALDRWGFGKLMGAEKGVDKALKEASKRLVNLLEVDPDGDPERLKALLESVEVEEMVRQVFSVSLLRASESEEDPPVDWKAEDAVVKDEFVALFERELGVASPESREAALGLFEAVLEAGWLALREMIDDRELGAHEALSGARFALIRGELERIRQKLDRPVAEASEVEEYRDFEERYRRSVRTVHRYIKPPHLLDEEQRVLIEELYVPPILLAPGHVDEASGRPLALAVDAFVKRTFRAVLLGNPGGGKSTFVQNLCVALSDDDSEPFYDGRPVTPLRVVLREYSKDRHEEGLSIVDHIEKTANSRYQVKAPAGAIEHLLNAGRVIVFFDGLDELLIPRHRRDIRSDIEAFCALYPAVPVIATSRVIGYDQAPLDPDSFVEFHLGQFRREDVYTYGQRWYGLMGTPDGSSADARAQRLIQETRDIADLAANPLMLALICNLTLAMRELPQSRPKIFEACSEMLFRKWDDQRGFAPVLPFDAHVKPTLEYLANWIYTNDQRQAGVGRSDLVETATEYLAEERFPTEAEARQAAETFIDHCTGRAWVFSDTGSTEDGELLYEFTHRTFLEYYAAQYVVSWSDHIDEVADWLVPRVAAARSDEVAQLVVHILCEQREQARDRLLGRLMEILDGEDRAARRSAEYFIARCLEFIVPSIAVTDRVVQSTVARLVRWMDTPFLERRDGPDPLMALGAALRCSLENRRIVLSAASTAIAQEIEGVSSRGIGALELGNGLAEVLRRTTMDSVIPQDLSAEVAAAGWEAVERCREEAERQARQNFLAAQICLSADWMSFGDFLGRFGLAALYRRPVSVLFRETRYESIAHVLERETGQPATLDDGHAPPLGRLPLSEDRRLAMLVTIGEAAQRTRDPWMHSPPPLELGWIVRREQVRRSPEVFFGAVCLILPVVELNVGPEERRGPTLLRELDLAGEGLEPELKRMNVSPDDRLYLKHWCERRFSLIGE
jgi:hypothetical protein